MKKQRGGGRGSGEEGLRNLTFSFCKYVAKIVKNKANFDSFPQIFPNSAAIFAQRHTRTQRSMREFVTN